MKVVAFNGSPRKEGNTFQSLKVVCDDLEQAGIDTEIVQVGGKVLRGCTSCYGCFKNKNRECVITEDELNDYVKKMIEADGIIIGSPVYFSNVSSETKALIDRAGLVARANDYLFARKAGAAVVAVRRAGATFAFSAINFFFFIQQMIVPGSVYWNLGIGREPGEVMKDEEGMVTFKTLGRNMAWLLKRLQA
jgi:multimeric flavodoxin WrbA